MNDRAEASPIGGTTTRPLVVIGVGNTMRRDDGVGPAVIDALRERSPTVDDALVELLTLDGESTGLVEAWRHRFAAIVIDASKGPGPPGAIRRLDASRDHLPSSPSVTSWHAAGVGPAIALAEELDLRPRAVIVFAVDVADLSPGEGLSPLVAQAVRATAERVEAELADLRRSMEAASIPDKLTP